MRTPIRVLSAALAVGAALAGALAMAAPAQAGAWNTWGSGSYHAGYDGVAGGSGYTLKGSACSGGDAKYFYTQLVQTSNGNTIGSSYSWPADGAVHTQGKSGTSNGVAYYTRWYGQNNSLSNGYSAPCAGGGFDS